jgi:hypothetical protein
MADREEESVGSGRGEVSPGYDAGDAGAEVAQEGDEEEDDYVPMNMKMMMMMMKKKKKQ